MREYDDSLDYRLLLVVGLGLLWILFMGGTARPDSWGPSDCSVVTESVTRDVATRPDGWYSTNDLAPVGQWQVRYVGGKLTESWNATTGGYFRWDNGKWAAIPRQFTEVLDIQPTENFGMDRSERDKTPPGKYYKGNPISRPEAISLVEKGAEIPADKLGWLVFVGTAARAAEVQRQLDLCPRLKSMIWFQAYDPKDWPVEAYALNTHPKFKGEALFLECLDGSVCHGQYEIKDGDLQNLEQNFKPEAVPDLREKTFIQKGLDYADENPVSCCVGAIILAIYLKKRKQNGSNV